MNKFIILYCLVIFYSCKSVDNKAPLVNDARLTQDTSSTNKSQNKIVISDSISFNQIGLNKEMFGDYAGAIEAYTIAVEKEPDSAKAFNNRSLLHNSLGNYKKALGDVNRAISLQPEVANLYNTKGLILVNLELYQEAINYYNEAIRLDNKIAAFYLNRAVAYQLTDEDKKVIPDCDRAILLDSKYAHAYFVRGISNYNLKNKDSACNDWKNAKKLGHELADEYINQLCSD